MIIEASSSRFENETLTDEEKFEVFPEDKPVEHFELRFYEEQEDYEDCPKKGKLKGALSGTILDEREVYNWEEMIDVADSIDGDIWSAIDSLYSVKKNRTDYSYYENSSCVYIHRLYVNEDSRRQGLATYMLKNLEGMMRYFFKTYPHFVVTIPVPEGFEEEYNAEEYKHMQKLMCSTLNKQGFKRIPNRDTYFKRCTEIE